MIARANRFMIFSRLCWLVALGFFAAVLQAHADSIVSGGITRTYEIFRPGSQRGPVPTVILLHGAGGTGAQLERFSDFDQVAAAAGIVAVYPQGVGRHWNDHRGTGAQSDADDRQFLLDLIGALSAKGIADPRHVYVAGISNGGLMALDMACNYADRIAGAGIVAASLPEGYRCEPARALPVIFFHGTEDKFIPFGGGRIAGQSSTNHGSVISAEETIGFFARANACRTRDSRALPDPVPPDGTHVSVYRYGDCAPGGALESVVIEGGGHSWPGARQGFVLDNLLGPSSGGIDTSAELWRFFSANATAP
jgi:polyhydroxybutyrate depolymerase